MANATAAPGRCVCPSLAVCTAEGLASALLRLPENVSSTESPWYWYLSTVYRGSLPPPPLPLRDRLQLLYPALLPTPVCLHPPRNSTLPRCSTAVCDAWQPVKSLPSSGGKRDATRARAAELAETGTFIWTKAEHEHDRRPFGHVVALQPPIAERQVATGWLEVLRAAAKCPEGWNSGGCWFHQTAGSGVWVYTGARAIAHRDGWLWVDGQQRLAWEPQPSWEPWERDRQLALETASRGFTSLQKVAGVDIPWGAELKQIATVPSFELVLMNPICMKQSRPLTTGCVPVPMTTGWAHDKPCLCDRTQRLINCEGTVSTVCTVRKGEFVCPNV